MLGCTLAYVGIILLLTIWIVSESLRVGVANAHALSRWYVKLKMLTQIAYGLTFIGMVGILMFCHDKQTFCRVLGIVLALAIIDLSFRYRDHETVLLQEAFAQRGHYIIFLVLMLVMLIYFVFTFKQWRHNIILWLIITAILASIIALVMMNVQWYNNKTEENADDDTIEWFAFIEYLLFVLIVLWAFFRHGTKMKSLAISTMEKKNLKHVHS
jgi:hypothetical protein